MVEHGVLGSVHAADLGAVGNPLFAGTGTDALDEDDLLRLLAVGGADDLAAGGAAGRGEALEGHAIDDVGDGAVAEFAVAFDGRAGRLGADVVEVEAGGDDDGADRFGDEFVLLGVVDRAGAADLLADAAFAAFEVGAVVAIDDRDIGDRLGEGDVDGGTGAEVAVEAVGDLFLRTLAHADAAAGAFGLDDRTRLLTDGDGEVADIAFDPLDFAVGQKTDLRMVGDIDHLRSHDALRTVEGGKGLGELGHVAADGGITLDQEDFVAAVGDIEGGLNAGDAATDDQGALGHRHGDRRQALVVLDPLDQHAHDILGLGRRRGAILMDPGAVLADVGHLAEERVHPCRFDRGTKCLLVHARRTGGNDYPVKLVLGHGLFQQVLPRIGAHVLVVAGMGDAGESRGSTGDRLDIDGARDIFPTMTNKNADSGHRSIPCRGAPCGCPKRAGTRPAPTSL